MRFCLLLVFLLLINGTILDFPGYNYTMTNETIIDTSLSLSGYQSILISNCSFYNTSISIENSDYLFVDQNQLQLSKLDGSGLNTLLLSNNIIFGFNESSIMITNITNTTIKYNTWYGSYDVTTNETSCQLFKYEIVYYIGDSSIKKSIDVSNNNLEISNDQVTSGLFKINTSQNNNFDSIIITNNQISLIRSDPFIKDTFTALGWCSYDIYNNLSNGINAFKSIISLYLYQSTISGTFDFENNGFIVNGTNSTTKTLHSGTDYHYDSLVNIIGLPMMNDQISFIIKDNIIGLNGYTGLFAPIRVGVLITNGTIFQLQNITNTFGLQNKYQNVANYLQQLNPLLNPYTFAVQIEPNMLDDYNGWDECNYACKRFCTGCYFTDTSTQYEEFSIYVDDICFNRQLFSNVTNATRLCRHEDLFITTPYTSNQALIFSSKNKVNGILRIQARDYGSVTFSVTDSDIVGDHYKYSLDQDVYNSDPNDIYFTNNHPFLIIPEEKWNVFNGSTVDISVNENAITKSITFTGINFSILNNGLNKIMFALQVQNATQHKLDGLIFDQVIIDFHNPSNTDFAIGYYFISESPLQSYYNKSITSFGLFQISNSTIKRSELYDSYLITDQLLIINNTLEKLGNGFIFSNITEKTVIKDNICTGCYLNSLSNLFLSVTGNKSDTTGDSIISNNIYSSSIPSIGSITYITFFVSNFNYIEIKDNSGYASGGIGLKYSYVTNYPCNAINLLKLENLNPTLNGTIYDVYCDPDGIGCQKDGCYNDITLAPEYCVVNKSYPVSGDYYKIVYFQTIQMAIDMCLSYPTRIIYINPYDIYTENLSIKNKNSNNETLLLTTLVSQEKVVVIGSNHLITSTTNLKFNISIDGFIFFNPIGILVYNPTLTTKMLSTGDTNTDSFIIRNSDFYSVQPVSVFNEIPHNKSGIIDLLNNLISYNATYPNIRRPNTYTILDIYSYGSNTYENLNIYGSENHGIKENRLASGETIIKNVYGENHLSSFIKLDNQYSLTINQTNCTYFCGGLVSTIGVAVVKIGFNNIATKFNYFDNTINIGPIPSGNPYFTSRLPYGNPFLGFMSSYAGRLASLWVSNMKNITNWIDFKFRTNRLIGYPIGVRIENSDNDVLALNTEVIFINDIKKTPRQIQYQNYPQSPTSFISGSVHDIKFGTIYQDDFLTQTNYCDQLCLPHGSLQICTVDTTSAITTTNYQSLTTAISSCPYGVILIIDTLLNESISTNFIYTTRVGTTLKIYSYGTTTIVGQHTFIQNCVITDNIPTTITFSSIKFRMDNPSDDYAPIIKIDPQVSSCKFSSIVFDGVTLTNTNTSNDGLIDGFYCDSCNIGNITWSNSLISGKFRYGLYITGTNSLTPPEITLSNNIVSLSTKSALVALNLAAFTITNNLFECMSGDTGIGCLYLYGVSSKNIIYKNIINSNTRTASSVLYNGIVWDLGATYSLGEVANVTIEFTQTITTSTRFGLQIVSNDIDSSYPCTSGTDYYISIIGTRNPNINGNIHKIVITDQSGVIIGKIDGDYPRLQCLVFDGLNSNSQYILTYVITALILLICLILFCIFCCDGLGCLFRIKDWHISENQYRKIK